MEDPFKKYYTDIPSGTPKKRRYKEFIEHPNYNKKRRFYHVEPLILDAGNFSCIFYLHDFDLIQLQGGFNTNKIY